MLSPAHHLCVLIDQCFDWNRAYQVANTHLLFNPKRGDVKLAQVCLVTMFAWGLFLVGGLLWLSRGSVACFCVRCFAAAAAARPPQAVLQSPRQPRLIYAGNTVWLHQIHPWLQQSQTKAKQTPRRTLRISLSNNVTGVQCSGSCLVSQASGRWWTCIRDSMALTPSPGALSLRSDLPDLPACRLCSPRPLHFESVCRPNSRQPCPRGVPVHDCPLSPCALCSCVCSAMVVGDFNAFPGSAVYELLRRGRLHGPCRALPCRAGCTQCGHSPQAALLHCLPLC